MSRVIFHIDINAFFANAHILLDPSLAGKPLVVAHDAQGSVVTTASYEARAFGIHSAMPLSRAKRLCRDLVVIEMDFDWYQELSDQFMKLVASHGDAMQPMSIDECYLDVSQAIKRYKRPLDLATGLQNLIMDKLKLPVSIGVAPNKFLAKMASDMRKPMGITVLRKRELETMLWPLSIEEMHGIGKKTVPRLKALGIHTIGDLASSEESLVRPVLGVNAQVHIDRANGLDGGLVETNPASKSMGQSKTLLPAIADYEELKAAIRREIDELHRRLLESGMVGKTVQFALRLENYKTASRSITLTQYTNDKDSIYEHVMRLFDEFEGEGAVSFISVTLANLLPREDVVSQINLFDINRDLSTDVLINRLNKALATNAFKRARDAKG